MFRYFFKKCLFLCCFVILVMWFLSAPDPHEDDACSHVPSADSTGAARLHLNTQHSLFTTAYPSFSCFESLSPLCILFIS